MASEQQQRRRTDESFERESTNADRDVHVEKHRVPQMASHFESLAGKETADIDSAEVGGARKTGGKETADIDRAEVGAAAGSNVGGRKEPLAGRVAVIEIGVPAEKREMNIKEGGSRGEGGEQNRGGGRMEEAKRSDTGAGKHGAASTAVGGEKVRGERRVIRAEERKGKETEVKSHGEGEKQSVGVGGEKVHEVEEKKKSGEEGGEEESNLSLEEITKLRALAQQNSMDILKAMEERYNNATEAAKQGAESAMSYASEKASQIKDTVAQGAQTTTQYVAEKAAAAKDTAVEKAQQGYQAAKEYTIPKAGQAKDYTAQKAVETKDFTVQKAADVTKSVAGYTVDTGKVAAHYTGKLAGDVKDKTAVAGWGAAHYTTEKTVEGTKLVARAVEGVAGKVGEVVAGAGHVTADLAKKSFTAAKDVAVSTEESVADYTARKREEAERQLEAKKGEGMGEESKAQGTVEGGGGGEYNLSSTGTAKAAAEAVGDILQGPPVEESITSRAIEVVEEEVRAAKDTALGTARAAKDTVQGTVAAARDTVGDIFQGQQGGGGGGGVVERGTQVAIGAKDTAAGTTKDMAGEMFQGQKEEGSGQQGGVNVLGAIGETIVEIAQTTKDIVVGPAQTRTEAALGYPGLTDSGEKEETGQKRLQKND